MKIDINEQRKFDELLDISPKNPRGTSEGILREICRGNFCEIRTINIV